VSSDKIYLSKEEQLFLMEMLEIKDPVEAAEELAYIMVEEKTDPTNLQKVIRKAMKAWPEYVKKKRK